jgi:hypothetical protein
MIQSIESVHQSEDGNIFVSAIIEDAVQTHAPTLYDPPEYGPALCEACFILEEDEILPDNEHELLQFIEGLDLTWDLVDNSDYYLD